MVLSCQKTGAEKVELPTVLRWAGGEADVSRSFRVAHCVLVAANWRVRAGI